VNVDIERLRDEQGTIDVWCRQCHYISFYKNEEIEGHVSDDQFKCKNCGAVNKAADYLLKTS